MLKRVTALAIAATLMGGCGAATPAAGPTSPTYSTLQASGQQQQPPEVTTIFPFLDGLGLTSKQKDAIEALLREQRPAVSQEEARTRGERFLNLLSQQTPAEDELQAHFTQVEETSRQEAAATATLFAGIRASLTPAQRTRAAANIRRSIEEAKQQADNQDNTQSEDRTPAESSDQPPDLKLTQAQQSAFAALAPAQAPDQDALATFFEKGDQAKLRAALQGPTSVAEQVRKLVAAYSSLTFTQRRQLVNYMRQQQEKASQANTEDNSTDGEANQAEAEG